jgi:hypothetical protein
MPSTNQLRRLYSATRCASSSEAAASRFNASSLRRVPRMFRSLGSGKGVRSSRISSAASVLSPRCCHSADDTIARCDRLIALYRDFHDRLKAIKGSMRLATIVDDLFLTPAAIVTWTARKTQVTYPTAQKGTRETRGRGNPHSLAERATNRIHLHAYTRHYLCGLRYEDDPDTNLVRSSLSNGVMIDAVADCRRSCLRSGQSHG